MFGYNSRANKRVARGAALLDADRPGWEEKVNLDRIDLLDVDNCILGQVYGDRRQFNSGFAIGVQRLNLAHLNADFEAPVQVAFAGWIKCIRYGFAQTTPFEQRTADAWRRLITARLNERARAEVIAAAEAQVEAEARCLAAAERIAALAEQREKVGV